VGVDDEAEHQTPSPARGEHSGAGGVLGREAERSASERALMRSMPSEGAARCRRRTVEGIGLFLGLDLRVGTTNKPPDRPTNRPTDRPGPARSFAGAGRDSKSNGKITNPKFNLPPNCSPSDSSLLFFLFPFFFLSATALKNNRHPQPHPRD
jgi:hypothetical protein